MVSATIFGQLHRTQHVDRSIPEIAKQLVNVVRSQQLPFLAAAIAYYAFLSIVPMLLVSIAIATVIAGQAVATRVVVAFEDYLTPEAIELLEETIVASAGRGSFTLIGLLVLLWGTLRVFRALDIAFSRVYGAESIKPIHHQIRDALLVIVGITVAITLTVLSSAALAIAPVPFAGLISTVGIVVVLPLVFFPLYYVFPAKDVTVREAIPGAIFAGVGWTALSVGYGIYTANAEIFQLYGVLGGVLLLLIWFYFGGMLLLLGAALNVVIAGREQRAIDDPQ